MADTMKTSDGWQANKTVIQCNEYMLSKEVLTDITLLVGKEGAKIKAHSYVLMSRSSVFFKLITESKIGSGENYLWVPDVDENTFRSLLRYMYCDELKPDSRTAIPLLKAGKKYAVSTVTRECAEYLKKDISTKNACEIYNVAHELEEKDLEKKSLKYIQERGEECLKSKHFVEMPKESLRSVLKSDSLAVSESVLYEAVVKWSENECKKKGQKVNNENKRAALDDLLYLIRFPVMEPSYFADNVAESGLLNQSEVNSVFHHYVCDCKEKHTTKFPTQRRKFYFSNANCPFKDVRVMNCHRLPEKDTIEWKYADVKDAIELECDTDIILVGFMIHRSTSKSAQYNVVFSVAEYEHKDTKLIEGATKVKTGEAPDEYSVYFPEKVSLKASVKYILRLLITGPASISGKGGRSEMSVDGINFRFSISGKSTNGTTIAKGQIPGLLFGLKSEDKKTNREGTFVKPKDKK